MATVSKFYLLDAVSPNAATMPGTSDAFPNGHDGTGDAIGARTARDATDVKGASNPDLESSITSTANQLPQLWGHRRFVSRPLALNSVTGIWTFSYARAQSNSAHSQQIVCEISTWRPGTGYLGTFGSCVGSAGAGTTETANSVTSSSFSITIDVGGDVLVFDVYTTFTQSMSTAYTDTFSYNGITEASITTCASFVTPPSAFTLFVPSDSLGIRDRRSTSRRGIRTVKV